MQEDVKSLFSRYIAPNQDNPIFREDIRTIDELDKQGISYLSQYTDLLQNIETSDELRRHLVSILGSIRYEPSIPTFLNIAQDDSKDVMLRRAGVVYSASIAPKAAYPVLADLALHHPSNDIRIMVTSLMYCISTKRCLRLLLKMMESDQNEEVRAYAARGVGLMTRKDKAIAVQPLISLLNNESETANVRAYAAEALAFIRDERGIDSLVRYLTDPSPAVRYMCAYAVGELGVVDQLATLETLLKDKAVFETWGTVAEAAQEAIEILTRTCPI